MKYLIIIKRLVYLISLISTIIGFYTSEMIYTIIFIVSFFVGLILSCITLCKAGTPRNRIHKGRFLYFGNRDLSEDKWIIYVKENKNGIWEVGDGYKTILDMSEWWRQKKYIAELISLRFILEAYNDKKQIALSLPFGSQRHRIENLTVCFIDVMGRKSQRQIIKNHICWKSLYLRYRLFCSLKVTGGFSNELRNDRYYKKNLFECYRFKRDQVCERTGRIIDDV